MDSFVFLVFGFSESNTWFKNLKNVKLFTFKKQIYFKVMKLVNKDLAVLGECISPIALTASFKLKAATLVKYRAQTHGTL